jgi:cob(I)alamin adenosyltransferase
MVNTGNGKGKTTAALGLLLRAWGHNMKVIMMQFVKSSTADYGEHRAARRIGIEIMTRGAGFTRQGKNAEANKRLAIELWDMAKEKINSGAYQMVVLDEFTYPLRYGWLSVEEVLDVLRHRPGEVHVVITGRDAPQELIDFADVATESKEVKHHLRKGIKAQAGVEF